MTFAFSLWDCRGPELPAKAPADRNETVKTKTVAKVFIFKSLSKINAQLENKFHCGVAKLSCELHRSPHNTPRIQINLNRQTHKALGGCGTSETPRR